MRVWAVTAVTPVASAIETLRNGTAGFFTNYFELRNAREQSRKLTTEVDRLRLENQFLKNELASAQRAESLAGFQAQNSFEDDRRPRHRRDAGSRDEVGADRSRNSVGSAPAAWLWLRRMELSGRVIAVFPSRARSFPSRIPVLRPASNRRRTMSMACLKGLGNGSARVDYVPTGQKVEVGEMLYTSGEDRVFPKGLPVGKVTGVHEGGNFQDITVQPSGTETAPEEVLVILDPVHEEIPDEPPANVPVFLAPAVKPGAIRAACNGPAGDDCGQADGPVQEDRRRPKARIRSRRAGNSAAELQPEGAGRECAGCARKRHAGQSGTRDKARDKERTAGAGIRTSGYQPTEAQPAGYISPAAGDRSVQGDSRRAAKPTPSPDPSRPRSSPPAETEPQD